MRQGQKFVAAASLTIAAASLIGYVFYRIDEGAAPLWDKVLVAYGVVFCLFLWFDRAAKSVADARSARRSAEPVRPRPRPGHSQRAAVLPAQSQSRSAAVTLERVVPQSDDAFLHRVQAFAFELGALDGVKPDVHDDGRVTLAQAERWQGSTVHPFQICADERVVGVCAVQIDPVTQRAALGVFYIDPEARRQHLGRAAMERVTEFLRLSGVRELRAEISANNRRGERFMKACGCTIAADLPRNGADTCFVLTLAN